MPLDRDLFENHLEFYATHHGTVIRQGGWILVDSGGSEFVVAFPEEKARFDTLPERFKAVRVLPWSGIDGAALTAAGFAPGTELSYLTMGGDMRPSSATDLPNVSIDVVTSRTAMEIFTRVEATSFLEEGETFDWWYAWLRQKNTEGLIRDLQRFYVASLDGEPSSVAITVLLERVLGIYGVATLPEHRKKGLSSAILFRAMADARELRSDIVALQVVRTGTKAEAFCKRAGFTLAFATREYVR